jgi:diguanylate cyclase (GGDEF)-like protein
VLGTVALTLALYALAGLTLLGVAAYLGLAAPVWPAAGIALALVYQRGGPAAAGVAAGSFVVNTVTLARAGALDSGAIALTAGLIAAGAMAQALLGAGLVRRRYGARPTLSSAAQVLGFLALAGPVACLINPTVGVGAQLLTGVLEPAQAPLGWLTWWAGDTIGVIVFAPLVLMLLPEQRDVWDGRRWKVAVPSVAVTTVLLAAFVSNQGLEAERVEQRQRQLASLAVADLTRTVSLQTEVLRGIEGFVVGSEDVTAEEFRLYTASAIARYPTISALSYNPYVRAAELDAFVAAQRAQPGRAGFAVTERDADGTMVAAGARPVYVPVQYIEPLAANSRALGYDIYSDPVRAAAIERARDTGEASATAPIELVQADATQPGALVLLPVYAGGSDPGSVAARRADLLGFSVGVLRLGDLVSDTFGRASWDGVQVAISDVTDADVEVGRKTDPLVAPTDTEVTRTVDVFGRAWQVEVTASQAALAGVSTSSVPALLLAGVLIIGLLEAFLLLVTGLERQARRRAESLGHAATHDPLTDLLNRRGLHAAIDRALGEGWSDGATHVLLSLDLDGFKEINDQGGHQAGDELLRRVAAALVSGVRRHDAVARIGGDEFAILLFDCGAEKGLAIAHQLVQAVAAQRVAAGGSDAGVSVSIGATTFAPGRDGEHDSLLELADRACYQAKQAGGGRVLLLAEVV